MPRAEISPEQKRRLAEALRANLARRKQQVRARRAAELTQPPVIEAPEVPASAKDATDS